MVDETTPKPTRRTGSSGRSRRPGVREPIEIRVNGQVMTVNGSATVAAALLNLGVDCFRRSASGDPRGPVCGMGTCFECRGTVDGVPHRRLCLEPCRPGMDVVVDE